MTASRKNAWCNRCFTVTIVSDGPLGSDTNTVVPITFAFDTAVRALRLSGVLLKTNDLTLPAEARVQLVSPTGVAFDVTPVTQPATADNSATTAVTTTVTNATWRSGGGGRDGAGGAGPSAKYS